MCVKRVPTILMKEYYALLMTSPKLASPVILQTFSHYPTNNPIYEIGQPHLEKNRNWSLLVHFDEQPQLHVVPIHVPVQTYWRDEPETNEKIPCLPLVPKVPYLA